jgi:UDP-N-acetylglucosamine--N-acetylmuramyl-(pentapeptide) pyrophosphoryl-undecaprenol N-acetylglucosamine transferase
MAGGTGGHVMPALAVARYLIENQIPVHWLGTRHGIEARLVPAAGLPISYIDIQGVRRRGLKSLLLAPFRIAKAFVQSCRIILAEQPTVVLSMGGYVAGPGALAAWCLRRPVVLHEQNAIPGTTNKILAVLAQRIMVAFPEVFMKRPAKVIFTGNPVREDIIAIKPPQERTKKTTSPLRILVLGGSQGATKLNEVVPQAIALLEQEALPVILHQTGKDHVQATKTNYIKYGVKAKITDFIDEMALAYEWADVVICRSGALTVSEIAAAGVASILIPFPFAVDDHQTANAQYLSEHGAAFLLPQIDFSARALRDLLEDLILHPEKRLNMAMASRKLAMPLATRTVAENCLEVSCGS